MAGSALETTYGLIASAGSPQEAANLIYKAFTTHPIGGNDSLTSEFEHFFKHGEYESRPDFKRFEMTKVLEAFTPAQMQWLGPRISQPISKYQLFVRKHGTTP
ncbi:hypothetical protein Lgee_1474 [Legionella geestiana]|uniref:Uncharacterized protein n=2 Tax=Legionella geestiana TaxID=45065 RepID=A0A0W0TSU8_9GAMM|nr:hypothetical protein [Legionella geestiana]KTC98785.1 hypothetical protein Lgee_1474 [Legionella geestiana]QBS12791.1 hypothetical protein E4T54_08555 [Legionella geestiana]STX54732.1 Uncharacterised protein [Legionella geestiana]